MEQHRRDCIDEYDELLTNYSKFMKLPYMENIILHIVDLFDVRTKSIQIQNTVNTVICHLYVYGFVIVANGQVLNSSDIKLHFIRYGTLPKDYHYIRNLSQYAYSSQNGSRLPANGDIFLFQNIVPVTCESNINIVDAKASAPIRSCWTQLVLLSVFGRNVGIRDILNADYPDFATIERKHGGEMLPPEKIIDFNAELDEQTTILADNVIHPAIKNGGNDVLMYMKAAIYIVIATLGLKPHVLGHLQPYEHIEKSLNESTLSIKTKMLLLIRTVVKKCELQVNIFLNNGTLPHGIMGKSQNKRKNDLKDIYGLNPNDYVLEDFLQQNDPNQNNVNEAMLVDDDDQQKKKRKKRTQD